MADWGDPLDPDEVFDNIKLLFEWKAREDTIFWNRVYLLLVSQSFLLVSYCTVISGSLEIHQKRFVSLMIGMIGLYMAIFIGNNLGHVYRTRLSPMQVALKEDMEKFNRIVRKKGDILNYEIESLIKLFNKMTEKRKRRWLMIQHIVVLFYIPFLFITLWVALLFFTYRML